uniref:Ubiquinone biosynthesis O-methyltransferase, mitochondrial n=1 Tax=Kalanchoe fedtschenkoi TaxID=63787 RepID=A0A7N0V3F8_KALFE
MATKLAVLRAANGHSRLLLYRPSSALLSARFLSDHSSAEPVQVPAAREPSSPQIGMSSEQGVRKGNRGRTLTSLKDAELSKFASMSETWWDAEGPFKPLHAMNPTRLAFIRSTLCRHFGRDPLSSRPLDGLRVADIGCGGGILSEPLARMGATVTGVDAVDKNIKIARIHADIDPITSEIEYCCTTAEALVEQKREFDAVIALEVIEHVANPAEFCQSLSALTISNGATIISTINRSIRGYAATIAIAEYILRWLPKGTHQWSSFITPEELVLILQRAAVNVHEIAGFVHNPLTGKWLLSDDISVNYIAFGTKERF